jgi:hypothetical protein
MHPTKDTLRAWDDATAELTRRAKIPIANSKKFHGEIFSLLVGATQVASFRERVDVAKAEKAVRAAYAAVRAMSDPQRALLEDAFYVAAYREISWSGDGCGGDLSDLGLENAGIAMLRAWVRAFAMVTGRSPDFAVRKGRGRPEETIGNWQLQQFVGCLWSIVREYDGDLSFSCKENRGTGEMVEVLKIFRPLLPKGLIPIALPAKTIERVKGTLGTKKYEPFGWISSGFRRRTYEPFNVGTP